LAQREKIIIKIFSDIKDVSSLNSFVKQLELKNLNTRYSYPKTFEINPNEIIIIQINNIRSKYLNKVLAEKNILKNKVIFVTQNEDAVLISSLVKLGFNNIFVFPYELYKFIAFLYEIIDTRSYITEESPSYKLGGRSDDFGSLIGNSPSFLKVINLAKKVALQNDANILILGETGTGKGHLAKAIHRFGMRKSFPFVDIICNAIPESLLESELFGYEPGAFTNARNRKFGLFEIAGEGTLFLDEIGDLTLNIQSKLLRTIERKLIRRLGGTSDIPIYARIISATNKNLEEMIENNLFRRDLYHRLNVVSLELPPLRSRGDDVLLLADNFIEEFNKQFKKSINRIEKSAKDFMMQYPWPGNVREFRNAIERAVLLSENNSIKLDDFSNLLFIDTRKLEVPQSELSLMPQFVHLDINFMDTNLKNVTKVYAMEVLAKMNGNKFRTAKVLGISRPRLDALLG